MTQQYRFEKGGESNWDTEFKVYELQADNLQGESYVYRMTMHWKHEQTYEALEFHYEMLMQKGD